MNWVGIIEIMCSFNKSIYSTPSSPLLMGNTYGLIRFQTKPGILQAQTHQRSDRLDVWIILHSCSIVVPFQSQLNPTFPTHFNHKCSPSMVHHIHRIPLTSFLSCSLTLLNPLTFLRVPWSHSPHIITTHTALLYQPPRVYFPLYNIPVLVHLTILGLPWRS
jgi:hypothetical protein